jgi:hypothetical protein
MINSVWINRLAVLVLLTMVYIAGLDSSQAHHPKPIMNGHERTCD